MVSRLAAAGETAKATLSPVERAPLVAVNFFVPTTLMLRSSKVANPLASLVRLVVPARLPVPVLRAMLTLIPETLLPKLSSARTVTDGLIATPARGSLGGCTKLRLVAAAGLTTTLLDVAPIRPVELKSMVKVVATLCDRLVNATTPPALLKLVVP